MTNSINKNILLLEKLINKKVFLKEKNNKEEFSNRNPKFLQIFKDIKQKYNNYNLYKIPMNLPYRKVYPEITLDDYYVATEADFKTIYPNTIDIKKTKDIDKFWELLKNKGSFKKSPLSHSEYVLIGNDIYRYSDHWGRVSSCMWDLIGLQSGYWDIGKANIKDFKPSRGSQEYAVGGYYAVNPEYIEKVLPELKTGLINLKNLENLYTLKSSAKKEIDKEIYHVEYLIKTATI